MKRIVLITSNHRRHRWLAARLRAAGCLVAIIVEKKAERSVNGGMVPEFVRHFEGREQSEARWFGDAPTNIQELGCPMLQLEWGQSGSDLARTFVASHEPDQILLFGSSIIKDPLLSEYAGRIINMHLGLSPYYRGSATNFWPLVDGLPECVGVTVHHAVLKVDAGKILAQARPAVSIDDNCHDIGCKAILAGASLLEAVVQLPVIPEGQVQLGSGKLCRSGDFNAGALQHAERNFVEGMMARYLDDKERRDSVYPIVSHFPYFTS